MVARPLIVLAALAALLALPGASLAHRPAPIRIVAPGPRAAGRGDPRRDGGPARLRQELARRLPRGRLPARGGPAVPDGLEPPPGERHARGAARLERARRRRAAPHVRPAPRGRAVARRSSRPRAKRSSRRTRKGVNAWLAANPLPSEYAALELTKAQVPAWTALDSRRDHEAPRLRALVRPRRPHQHPAADRLPDRRRRARLRRPQALLRRRHAKRAVRARAVDPTRRDLAAGEGHGAPQLVDASASTRRSPRRPVQALRKAERAGVAVERTTEQGSNIWVVSGKKSASGRPMVASDPHLSLALAGRSSTRSGVDVDGRQSDRLTLYGVTFPGAPGRRARHERPRLVGLDREPDRRHRRLPGAARRRRRRSRGDDVQGDHGADADHPGDLPDEPAGQRHRRRPGRRAARGGRPGRDGRRPAPEQRPADQRHRHDRAVRPVHGLQRDPRGRLLPPALARPTTSPRRSTPSATSTSARRTGCTPTTAATSATRRAPRSRCARISRPARSPACRRTSSATAPAATSGSPTRRAQRTRRSRTRSSRSPRWTAS